MHFSASFGPITSIPICAFQGAPSHFSAIFGTNHSTSRISGYCKFYRLARPFLQILPHSSVCGQTAFFLLVSNSKLCYPSHFEQNAHQTAYANCTVFKQIKMHIGNIRMFKFCDLYCYTVQLWLFV